MGQALHILRKDIRYLWIEISTALTAVGLFLFTAIHSTANWNAPLPRTIASFLMQFLLPFAWWTLITRAVHAEPLIGDRQFWPTRPYAWSSLLAAKALLCLLFVNLPVFTAQCMVLAMHGFSPAAELPGLLWSQVLLTGFVILPIAALACLTATVAQFLVLGLVCFVVMLLLSFRFLIFAAVMTGGGWGPMGWFQTYYGLLIVLLATPAILVWQYSRRQTWPVRGLAIAALVVIVLGVPFSWSTAFAMQSRLSPHPVNAADARAGMNSNFQWMIRALVERDGRVNIHVPLQITGLPDDLTVQIEGLEVSIDGANGTTWHAPAEARANVTETGQLIALQTLVDGSFYQKVKDQPSRMRGYLYVTLYGNHRISKLPFNEPSRTVPGLGICSATKKDNAPYFLTCDQAFRGGADLISVRFEESTRDSINYIPQRGPSSYSPFPASFGVDPLFPYVAYSTYRGSLDAVTINTLEPLAHVKIPLAVDGLKLADYEKKL